MANALHFEYLGRNQNEVRSQSCSNARCIDDRASPSMQRAFARFLSCSRLAQTVAGNDSATRPEFVAKVFHLSVARAPH